ncbi:hypothetical protein BWQ96_06230 [Gracilariopsis chorda]|uniref:RING-type domain-containing protein n=1 Tax=Gracilariopsis chorda TaxID=448386 RepID=A0A2V3IPL5_9FLOR|nr:hypothetical protein BWQ96_06230 [Gracilariopsis chorda]|eukprot:PXF43997.1 hypothetical protein BWQ96_06230 [Gracilariopsis chorda]
MADRKQSSVPFHCGVCAAPLNEDSALLTSCGHFFCGDSHCSKLNPALVGRCEQCGRNCNSATLENKAANHDSRVQQFVFTNVAQQLRNLADVLDFRHTHKEILTYNVANLHRHRQEIDALKQRDRELKATVQSLREEARSLNSNIHELNQQLRLQQDKFMEQIDALRSANTSLRRELTKIRTNSQLDAASQEPKMLANGLTQRPSDPYGDASPVTRPKQTQFKKLSRDPRKPLRPPALPSGQGVQYRDSLYGRARHHAGETNAAISGRDKATIPHSHEIARYQNDHQGKIAEAIARNGGIRRTNDVYATFSTTRNAPQKSYPSLAAGPIGKRGQPQYRLRDSTEESRPTKLRRRSDWSQYASTRMQADRALSGRQQFFRTSQYRRVSSVVKPSASTLGSYQKRFRSDRGLPPNRRTLF